MPMSYQLKLFNDHRLFVVTNSYDKRALAMYLRHYSRKRYTNSRKVKNFMGTGEKIVLVLPDYTALFCWLYERFRRDNQQGLNCTIFRNESNYLSSELIKEAEVWAYERWGMKRLYTFVNANKIQSSNPGFCFLKAGWRKCGISKIHKHIILEKVGGL